MSDKASFSSVPKVEIELSEKGLTDLAALLVKSGVLSAPSFQAWAQRTSQHASRWARPNRSGTGSSKDNVPKKKGKTGNANRANPVEEKKESAKELKEKATISGFSKLFPDVSVDSFADIKNLSPTARDLVNDQIGEFMVNDVAEIEVDRRGIATTVRDFKGFLEAKGLTADEVRQSRKYFPVLPSPPSTTDATSGEPKGNAPGSVKEDNVLPVEPEAGKSSPKASASGKSTIPTGTLDPGVAASLKKAQTHTRQASGRGPNPQGGRGRGSARTKKDAYSNIDKINAKMK